MKKLEEEDIVKLMKEEWHKKTTSFVESVDAVLTGKVDGKEKNILSPQTKLRHKKTLYLYDLVSVGPRDVILKTPEGKQFIVDKSELEKDYELD